MFWVTMIFPKWWSIFYEWFRRWNFDFSKLTLRNHDPNFFVIRNICDKRFSRSELGWTDRQTWRGLYVFREHKNNRCKPHFYCLRSHYITELVVWLKRLTEYLSNQSRSQYLVGFLFVCLFFVFVFFLVCVFCFCLSFLYI